MKRRILEIIPTLDRAGAEKQLSLLAAGLPTDEFDVHVCALTRGGPMMQDLEKSGVAVTVIGKRWKIDPQAFLRLKRFVADWEPDLIHTWIFAANAYGRAAGVWCKVKCLGSRRTLCRSLEGRARSCHRSLPGQAHGKDRDEQFGGQGVLHQSRSAGREVRGHSERNLAAWPQLDATGDASGRTGASGQREAGRTDWTSLGPRNASMTRFGRPTCSKRCA